MLSSRTQISRLQGIGLEARVALMMAFTMRDGRNLVSLFGLFVFIDLAWLFSWKPTKVKLRPVIEALFFQRLDDGLRCRYVL
jgi:hypothetical protein